jgi:hypothetical protein
MQSPRDVEMCGPRVFLWHWAGAPNWVVDVECVWSAFLHRVRGVPLM